MVATWVSLLKTVPWTDVIANAPAITDGAKKLWNTVARKSPTGAAADAAAKTSPMPAGAEPLSPQAEALDRLHGRVDTLSATVVELQGQMLASTELIKSLADQNTELIARVEVHRRRLLWLSGTVAVVAAVAVGHLILTWKA